MVVVVVCLVGLENYGLLCPYCVGHCTLPEVCLIHIIFFGNCLYSDTTENVKKRIQTGVEMSRVTYSLDSAQYTTK